MEKVLFAKFNSLRAPMYRTGTIIAESNGNMIVKKTPLTNAAKSFVSGIAENCRSAEEIYSDIKYLECKMVGDDCVFPFVTGKSIIDNVDFKNGSLDDICCQLGQCLEPLWSYNPDNILPEFATTEEFTKIFGNIAIPASQKALKVSNIDPVPENFVIIGDKIICFDYEWTFRFPVPIDFPRFRALRYLYEKERMYLDSKADLESFLSKMGLEDEAIKCFFDMEEAFQQLVHGDNRKYIYTDRYVKNRLSLSALKSAYNEVPVLSKTIENLNELHHIKDKALDDKDKAIADRDKMIKEKDRAIVDRDKMIEDRNESIVSQQQEIERRESLIVNQQKEIESRGEAIAYRDGIIAVQEQKLAKIKRGIKNPFYGMYLAGRYVAKKVYQNIGPKDVCYMRKKYGRHWKEHIEQERAEQNPPNEYEKWISVVESRYSSDEVFAYNPKISVIIPVYNVEDVYLKACIDSVLNQTYQNFEICIADDNSTFKNVKPTLKSYASKDSRVKIVFRSENGHISVNSNTALSEATGDYVALLDCDDTLSLNALYEVVKYLNLHPECDYVYSDEDKLTDDGLHRHDPHFKPDWSPDTFMSVMYTCHLSVFRKTLIDEIGGFRIGVEGAQDYDLVLRVMEKTNNIGHIAKILYHWRERNGSTANDISSKGYVNSATEKAKMDALDRRGVKGHLEWVDRSLQCRVVYDIIGNPKVSIVIPSKDNFEVLRRCIESIYERTDYKNFEIIVVDNGSCDYTRSKVEMLASEHGFKYVYKPSEFNFSAMCNLGANNTDGDLILFLNDDIEIQGKEWLERLIGHSQQAHTGAVGCKLYYPDGHTIQHNGVVNLYNNPGHVFYGFDDTNANFYYSRNLIDYNFMIVTAAALMVARSKFDEIGGFDETLPIAYNDVELCFKLVEHGYYNVLRTDVALIHHESVSRGLDKESEAKRKRLDDDLKKLYELHPKLKSYDPCYNINLTQTQGDFSYNTELIGYRTEAPTIYYSLDSMSFREMKGELRGWAYETATYAVSPFVKVELVAASGSVPKLKRFAISRRDVVNLKHLPNETDEGKYGFLFEWVIEEGETYYLKFTSDVSVRAYKIDVEGELRKERERRRKYISEAEMLAADDPYREEDDSFYKDTLGQAGYEAIVRERLNCQNVDYDIWREHHLLTTKEIDEQKKAVFDNNPVISIAVPLYRTPEKYLREMIDSVLDQTYDRLELCLADGSMNDSVAPVVQEYMQNDDRIKYVRLDSNLGISENTNEAIKLATGDYIALLDHDDYLELDALYEIVKRINETGADVIYTDEDKCSSDRDRYYDPNFKPDFNKEYLFSCNYITHFFVAHRTIVDKVGLLDSDYDGSQDYDFILRCTQEANRVEHIARVLYHWRCHLESTAMNPEAKMYCYESGRKAIEAALKRDGEQDFNVKHMPYLGLYHTVRTLRPMPRIHIISIQENQEWLERNNLDGAISTSYARIDDFFQTAIANDAEYVLYLGIKITDASDNWIDLLVSNCARRGIAAVSGRIIGTDKTIIHSGMVIQADGSLRDLYKGEGEEVPGFNGRNILAQDIDASVPACLMLRANIILDFEGYSDKSISYQSVMIGLKLLSKRMRMIYLPDVTVYGEETNDFSLTERGFEYGRLLYNPNYDSNGQLFTLTL